MSWLTVTSKCLALALLSLASSCITAGAWTNPGNTIVVDAANGPGAHFTDIPPAIAAAQPGDLVLVRPGEYSSFLLNKALTIVGAPNGASRVSLPSSLPTTIVGGIAAGDVVAIADLDFPSILGAWGTHGTVAFDGCRIGRLITTLADDVRVNRSPHVARVQAQGSHAEIVSSTVGGGFTHVLLEPHELGIWGSLTAPSIEEHGWPSVAVHDQSKLIAALTRIEGRHVYWDMWQFTTSLYLPLTSGTSAVRVEGSSTIALIGTPAHVVRGGDGQLQPGVNYGGGFSGIRARNGGDGVELESGQGARSGVELIGGIGGEPDLRARVMFPWMTFDGVPVSGADAAKLADIVPDNPTLELLDTPKPGAKVRLRVRGPAGSKVVVAYGAPTIVPVTATRPIETLVATADRLRPGDVPASGEMTFEADVPAALTTGSHVFLQAHLILPSGDPRVSNSIVLVAR